MIDGDTQRATGTRRADMDGEDLSALIRRVQAERPELTQSEIARRLGISVSAVSNWINRKRGTSRGPNRDVLRALARVLGVPEREVFDAVARKLPGPTSPDAEERIIELFRGLTAEQQHMVEIQLRAVYEKNQIDQGF